VSGPAPETARVHTGDIVPDDRVLLLLCSCDVADNDAPASDAVLAEALAAEVVPEDPVAESERAGFVAGELRKLGLPCDPGGAAMLWAMIDDVEHR
jgi:hypothetical protein